MLNGSKSDFFVKNDYSSDFEILSGNDIIMFILSIECIFWASRADIHEVWC